MGYYDGGFDDYGNPIGGDQVDAYGNPIGANQLSQQQTGIPYTSANAPSVYTPGFQQPSAGVPPWQVATGNGAAPAGSFLPDWRPGQPDQQGATDASGVAYPDIAPPVQTTTTDNGGVVGGGNGGQTAGQGLFNPSLYAPFQGQAPSYSAPQLPNAPSFDSYYSAGPTPNYQAPALKQAPAFSYDPFHAPTLSEAQNQPGYQFGVQQGEKALQQSRASQGLLRTGGTLKDILDYGRNAATQNYGNVFNQNKSVYDTNRSGAVQQYNTNYQTQYKDPNDAALLNAQTSFQDQLAGNNQALNVAQARFAPQLLQYQTNTSNAQRQAELGYNADWQKYLDSENVFYTNQQAPFSKYLSLAQLGAANA